MNGLIEQRILVLPSGNDKTHTLPIIYQDTNYVITIGGRCNKAWFNFFCCNIKEANQFKVAWQNDSGGSVLYGIDVLTMGY